MPIGANQFTAKIRFEPVAWRAYDDESWWRATVIENGYRNVTWFVVFREDKVEGTSTSASGARAACRRVIAKRLAERRRKRKKRAR